MAVFTTLIEIAADAGQHRQGTVCHADHLGKSDKIRRPCQLVTAHVAACAANQPRTTKIRHDRFKELARNILFFGNRADLTGAMGIASDIEKRLERITYALGEHSFNSTIYLRQEMSAIKEVHGIDNVPNSGRAKMRLPMPNRTEASREGKKWVGKGRDR